MLVPVVFLLLAQNIEGLSVGNLCVDENNVLIMQNPSFAVTSFKPSPWPPSYDAEIIQCTMTGLFVNTVTASYVSITLSDYGTIFYSDIIPIRKLSHPAGQTYTFYFNVPIFFGYFVFGNYELDVALLDPNYYELNCWAAYFSISY